MSENAKSSRVRYPRKNICQWKKILFEYFNNNGDGLTVTEFCGKHNVGEHAFYKWRRKLYPRSFKGLSAKVVSKSKSVKAGKSDMVRFIAVRPVGDSVELAKSELDIVSPLKISLSGLDFEFGSGCKLLELKSLISVLHVVKAG